MKPLKTFLFLAFFLASGAVETLQASVSHLSQEELLAKADLVALGEIISVDQGMDATHAQLRILQVYKGLEQAPGSLVTIESAGGKVFIDETQPSFMTLQVNLLFLQKTPSGYVCVNQADGQKVVRGENIYPYYDNLSYSVSLKDYLKTLDAALKAGLAAAAKS